MPRNRMIKADFWADEKIGKLSDKAKLLFIGCWTFADDSGVCRANNVYLRNNIFPYDEKITSLQIKETLQELINSGIVIVNEYSGELYLYIVNFKKHQVINKPSAFRFITEDYRHVFSSSVVVVDEQLRPKVKEKVKEKVNILGEFKNILLSDDELEKLKKLYGIKFNEAIEKLSSYIEANNKKYTNHYAVLGEHNWVYKEIIGKKKGSGNNAYNGFA